jgi:hypothetical protein
MFAEHKPTDWKNVKENTPVLFRWLRDSEYEDGRWAGGTISAANGDAFFWSVTSAADYPRRDRGTSITETGEWHIDPHYCKLA